MSNRDILLQSMICPTRNTKKYFEYGILPCRHLGGLHWTLARYKSPSLAFLNNYTVFNPQLVYSWVVYRDRLYHDTQVIISQVDKVAQTFTMCIPEQYPPTFGVHIKD